MKTRTKLLTALLSTVTALSCALTAAAATTPSIELQGNEATPVTLGMTAEAQKATVTLKATDFATVGGADITLTLPNGITFNSATVTNATTGSTWTLAKDENYKVDLENKKIKFVDVFNLATDNSDKLENVELNITFDVKTADIGTYEIGVSAKLANTDATEMAATTKVGNIVIGRKQTTYKTNTINSDGTVAANEFIPYGGAYTASKVLEKNEDGKFDLTGVLDTDDITVLKCKLPTGNNVTTFGANYGTVKENDVDKDTIQFGSYIDDVAGLDSCGTLLIASYDLPDKLTTNYVKGNYAEAVDSFATSEDLFKDIITKFTTGNKIDGKFHPYKYGSNKIIYACVVQQKNYMWKSVTDTTLKKLQYGVRCVGLNDTTKAIDYTAVGYTINSESSYNFSTEIKTDSYNNLYSLANAQ